MNHSEMRRRRLRALLIVLAVSVAIALAAGVLYWSMFLEILSKR